MRARPAPLLLPLLGPLFLASPARAEARAPPDLPFVLLPGAPGADELSLSRVTPPDHLAYAAPWPALVGVGVGMGAGAVWGSHALLFPPVHPATRAQSAALFAVTGAGALAVLAGAALPRSARPWHDVRGLLIVGPGGFGLTVAVPF